MIQFGEEVCGDLGQACALEWLETNGIGGFASSTIIGQNTRRYHGLIVAATNPPTGRMVLLSKVEEVLIVDGRRFELGTNQYPGMIHPHGSQYLKRFRLDPYPIFSFEVQGLSIEKHLCMLHGENSVVLQYKVLDKTSQRMTLELRPMAAFRDYHCLTHKNDSLNPAVQQTSQGASFAPYQGLPTLHFAHNAGTVSTDGAWYYSFQYAREQERGLDWQEDLFNPCCCEFELNDGKSATLIASTQSHDIAQVEQLLRVEVARRHALSGPASAQQPYSSQLSIAADQFIVSRGSHKTIIAGYHWFTDWGRDTMISLPGLCLSTGRVQDAKDILLEFSQHINQGMLPNRFPDAAEAPEYNTVDATLWYFEAVRAYYETSNDEALAKVLFPLLVDIIDWHVKGTRFEIYMESNGLLHSGPQLTWMDARVGDWNVTPRAGKAVEIQALWYNALCIMEALSNVFSDERMRTRFRAMADAARESFNKMFWNDEAGCLFDIVSETPDASVRPNQVFAVSLHHSMLSAERAREVVEKVQRELLTPFGLRTLSPSDSHYVGHYAGDQRSRDGAYHQGTVWPWLIGPFIEAYIKVHGDKAATRKSAALFLENLLTYMNSPGVGTIPEIFDGDAPHAARGCIAQAWSVAEALRASTLIQAAKPARQTT